MTLKALRRRRRAARGQALIAVAPTISALPECPTHPGFCGIYNTHAKLCPDCPRNANLSERTKNTVQAERS